MDQVTDFEWPFDSTQASWSFGGRQVRKFYADPIRSAVVLLDGTGVALVEPYQAGRSENAVVFNADGSERFRVKLPVPDPRGYWFEQMYYVQGVLTAFATVHGVDRAYAIDEHSGSILRTYETR